MSCGFLDLNSIQLEENFEDIGITVNAISNTDVAIIGIAGKFGSAENLNDLWKVISEGHDCIRPIPENRKTDTDIYLANKGVNEYKYLECGYLSNIDLFDYTRFSLAPKEAALADPNQRLFIEAALTAIENSGYGEKRLKNTNTGVFVGYSSDFGESYKNIIHTNDPDSVGISVAGNVKSIIASRISYLLDLKGPSMLVDTACSSSLVSIHLACKSLQRGECEIAIAGGVKTIIVPVRTHARLGVGIAEVTGVESANSRTKTFDNAADGTAMGEGVGVLLLKPLYKAIEDRDNVYAVIKGSAINQDGSSVGITAPNADAQAEVIASAWKDAGIDPETISYIEAHGTGTKLGDPVEIKGIQIAFSKYTSKKQFCAIGSIKTNIGHLDHAAGIAGILKLVLALKNKQIPPIINFNNPNRSISFEDSPAYISDCLHEWDNSNKLRRCGISSFGLSGTNCHIILEEAPQIKYEPSDFEQKNLITFSATTAEALTQLIKNYIVFCKNNENINITDLAYTNGYGRGHYQHRLAIITSSINDLIDKLSNISDFETISFDNSDVLYSKHNIIFDSRKKRTEGEISQNEVFVLNGNANQIISKSPKISDEDIKTLAKLYIKGADIEWVSLFKNSHAKKIELPTSYFNPIRCWVEGQNTQAMMPQVNVNKELIHPLVDSLITRTKDNLVFESNLSVENHWELRDHKIKGKFLLPGTSYLEMIREMIDVSGLYLTGSYFLKDVIFLNPLTVEPKETRRLHTIFINQNNTWLFTVNSKFGENWLVHCEGKIMPMIENKEKKHNVKEMLQQYTAHTGAANIDFDTREIEAGKRWYCSKELLSRADSYLVKLELPNEFKNDLNSYFYHISLSDCAVNATNFIVGEGLFLPLSYKSIIMYKALPERFYSMLTVKSKSSEVVSFDIEMIDESGEMLADIAGYNIKKVRTDDISKKNTSINLHHEIKWNRIELLNHILIGGGDCLVFSDNTSTANALSKKMKAAGNRVFIISNHNSNVHEENTFFAAPNEEEYAQLFNRTGVNNVNYIIHAYGVDHSDELTSENIQQQRNHKLTSLMVLVKSLLKNKIKINGQLIVLTVNAFQVDNLQYKIFPMNTALHAMVNGIGSEYPNLNIRSVDVENIETDGIYLETKHSYPIAVRNGVLYQQTLENFNVHNGKDHSIKVSPEAAYIITGGLGSLGLEFAQYLTQKGARNIVLINRNVMPDASEWDSIASSTPKITHRINCIKKMQQEGVNIIFCKADVSDYSQLENLIENIGSQYNIKGLVHCAGIAGNGYIINKNIETFNSVLQPKIDGTFFLYELLKDYDLDFTVLFSSISSVLGTEGQIDYAAANSFLNAFSTAKNAEGKYTIAVNWSAWSDVGMAVDFGAQNTEGVFTSIAAPIALEAFDAVIGKDAPAVIIAGINTKYLKLNSTKLPFKITAEVHADTHAQKAGTDIGKSIANSKNIILNGEDAASMTDTIVKIGNIWGYVLGLEEIDIYNNFYNLGGNSILATQMLKKYETDFPGIVEVADIFTYTTIFDMATYVDKQLNKNNVQDQSKVGKIETNIDDILEKLAKGEIQLSEANNLIFL